MPSAYNGIGTWYYGAENVRRSVGECEHCGFYGLLRSYDTTEFFIVLFVPLLPIGKKRIVDECPNCKRHRVMPLKKYHQLRERELARAARNLKDNPNDVEKIKHAIGAYCSYFDEETFDRIAQGLKQHRASEAEVMLTLGHGYDYFHRPEEALHAYQAAVKAQDTPANREVLATHLIKHLRPDEGEPLLAHIFDEKNLEEVGLTVLLVEAYQAQGRHDHALRVMDKVVKSFPQLEDDSELLRKRKLSEKHRSTEKQIRSPLFRQVEPRPEKSGRLGASAARLVGPGIALGAVVIYLAIAWLRGQSREIYVVNGLSDPYRVSIAGQEHLIQPAGHLTMNVAEGSVEIKVLDSEFSIPAQTCRIETPFFSRPFSSHLFVVNPDRTALVVQEKTIYSNSPHAGDANATFLVHVGESLYSFDDVDYAFREFPKTITTSNKNSNEWRTRVYVESSGTPEEVIDWLYRERGQEICAAYARRMASHFPDNEVYLNSATWLLSGKEGRGFFSSKLTETPIRIHWHRGYQTYMQREFPDYDLESDYRTELAKNPEDTARMYLLARATRDPEVAHGLLLRATEGKQPCAFAHLALAYRHLSRADYKAALDACRRAIQVDPKQSSFRAYEEHAMFALGMYDDLAKRLRTKKAVAPADIDLATQEITLQLRMGRKSEARAVVDQFYAAFQNQGTPDDLAQLRAYLEGIYHYQNDDIKQFIETWAVLPNEEHRFQVALSAGRIDEAVRTLETTQTEDPNYWLLVFVVALPEDEQPFLDKAIHLLRARGHSGKLLAACLSGEQKPDVDRMLALEAEADAKAIYMAAMGKRFPDDRARYFKLARKLNFNTAFPHLILDTMLKSTAP